MSGDGGDNDDICMYIMMKWLCDTKNDHFLRGLPLCLSVKMSTSSRGSVGAPRETPKITTSSKLNNNIPSDPARPLGRPLTSDDDDGRWDNK